MVKRNHMVEYSMHSLDSVYLFILCAVIRKNKAANLSLLETCSMSREGILCGKGEDSDVPTKIFLGNALH